MDAELDNPGRPNPVFGAEAGNVTAINLFVPAYRIPECLAEIEKCLEIGWTGLGFKTIEFENEWKAYTGLPNVHYLNSATAGLHLAVKILKEYYRWNDGDEIISTPITFVSTNHAILHERLNVVFADVDESLCLDPGSVEERITQRTRAVMFVGMGGNIGSYYRLVEICRSRGLKLILDAAHLAGTRYLGAMPGGEADVVVYSYQAVKNLPTGDSGAICFANPELARIARRQSWLGIDKDTFTRSDRTGAYDWKYNVLDLGHKYHGNSIMAAIAIVQLRYLDGDNSYRRQIAAWYDELFAGHEQIAPIPSVAGCESSRHLYQIAIDNRDETISTLNRSEIYPGVHYIDNTSYDLYRFARGTCPRAHRMSNRILSLPCHIRLTQQDVIKVAEHVIRIARGLSSSPLNVVGFG